MVADPSTTSYMLVTGLGQRRRQWQCCAIQEVTNHTYTTHRINHNASIPGIVVQSSKTSKNNNQSDHLLFIGPSKCQSPSLEMNSWFQSSRALFAFSMNVSMVMPSSEAIAGRAARHQRRARYSSVQGGWHRYIRRQLAFSYSTAASSEGSLSLGYMTLTSLFSG